MSIKGRLWQVIPSPITRRFDEKYDNFSEWRSERPFLGASLLMLAGVVIGWVPIQFATELALIAADLAVIGLIFATMVFLCGAFVMARPELSTIFGVIGIAMSILSIIGAAGGLGLGLLLGLIGGNLCVAWRNPEGSTSGNLGGSSTEEVQFSWQGDQ